jgi:hypothetical protein
MLIFIFWVFIALVAFIIFEAALNCGGGDERLQQALRESDERLRAERAKIGPRYP